MSSKGKTKFGISAFKETQFKHESSKLALNYGIENQLGDEKRESDIETKQMEPHIMTPKQMPHRKEANSLAKYPT